MRLKRTDIEAYYDVCNVCNNDVAFVSFLLVLFEVKNKKSLLKDLENLKTTKYENQFNFILNEFRMPIYRD